MRYLTLAAALGLWSAASHAQLTPPAPPLSVQGTVRDSTGRALARVEVSHGRIRTVSDADGNFRLAPVPAGRITVRFTRDGVFLGELVANVTRDSTRDVNVEVLTSLEPRSLVGTVVDSAGAPVGDAMVEVVTALVEVRTSAQGTFVLRDLPARRHLVRVRRVGFAPTYLTADLTDSTASRIRVVMREFAGQFLGTVVVKANRGPARLERFLARAERGNGFGRFITAEDILRRNPLVPSDLLLAMPGVRVTRSSRGGSLLLGRGGCRMDLIINGFPAPQLPGSGIDELVNVLDLAGIEVYPGIGGTPSELLIGQPNPCGTVGVWTR